MMRIRPTFRGFTLIELLVVIAIIDILIAVLVRPGFWNGQKGGTPLGNIAFVDGHVSFMPQPKVDSTEVAWLE